MNRTSYAVRIIKYASICFIVLLSGAILYKIYIPHIQAFGCFDDCFNYLGGYFLNHDKHIYSDFFFNHNPLPAYISAYVQQFSHPSNIHELLLRHRQVLIIFGTAMNLLIALRFGVIGLGIMGLYELTKFYTFGDRFLAESFIVYPAIYLLLLWWFCINDKKRITLFDAGFTALCSWFIFFMREPYIPLSLLLFVLLLFSMNKNLRLVSLGVFSVLTIILLANLSFPDYYFNIFTANKSGVETTNIIGIGAVKAIFYPLFILSPAGEWGFYRWVQVILSGMFIFNFLYFILRSKKYLISLILLTLLFTANLRFSTPGKVFYGEFHMNTWFALFITSILALLFINIRKYQLSKYSLIMVIGCLLFITLSKKSFIYEKPDQQFELITNYGPTMQIGNVIKALKSPEDTLFLDGADDLIYWQAEMMSPYKYVWFTAATRWFDKYNKARLSMFKVSPPTFYYGSCPKENPVLLELPDFVKDKYVNLLSGGKPTCLYLLRSKAQAITPEQRLKINELLYDLPSI